MRKVSRWRTAITNEPYDIQFLVEMRIQMDVRQELWKYFEVSTLAIQEWKNTYFKKVAVQF